MNKAHFIQLATFNVWANRKMVDFIRDRLNKDEAEKEIVSSFSSVTKTVYHLWDAEVIWLERLRGNSLREFPSVHFKGTMHEGWDAFMSNSAAILEFLSAQEEGYFGMSSLIPTPAERFTNRRSLMY